MAQGRKRRAKNEPAPKVKIQKLKKSAEKTPKAMSVNAVSRKIESLVSVLVRGGYEAVVVAVLPEDDQLVQAASSAGTRYLDLHPTFLEGLLPFCKHSSQEEASPCVREETPVVSDSYMDEETDEDIGMSESSFPIKQESDTGGDDSGLNIAGETIRETVDNMKTENQHEVDVLVKSEKKSEKGLKNEMAAKKTTKAPCRPRRYIPRTINPNKNNTSSKSFRYNPLIPCVVKTDPVTILDDRFVKTYSAFIFMANTTFRDFLKKDINKNVIYQGSKYFTGNVPYISEPSDLKINGITVTGFAENVLEALENLETCFKNGNNCSVCKLVVTKSKQKSHYNTHLTLLDQNLHVCRRCKIQMPQGYIEIHNCVSRSTSIPCVIQIGNRDVRDEIAYLEFAQKPSQNTSHSCHFCSQDFTEFDEYKKHVIYQHMRQFACTCGMNLKDLQEIKCHVETVQCVDDGEVHRCLSCESDLSSCDELLSHVASIHSKTELHKCTKCHHWFSCPYLQTNHTCSKAYGFYRCSEPNCHERFDKYTRLQRHKVNVHGIGGVLCSFCGKRFLIKGHLENHMEWAHSEGNEVECKICGRKCKGPNSLRNHVRTHATERLWSCEICGFATTTSANLRSHRRSHYKAPGNPLGKTRECEVCDKKFCKLDSLRAHILSSGHTTSTQNVKPDKVMQCAYCSKKFLSKERLRRHENTHTRTADHMCSVCGKAFIDKSNLRQHMWIHTGKPKCQECNLEFRSAHKHVLHMRTVHNILLEEAVKRNLYVGERPEARAANSSTNESAEFSSQAAGGGVDRPGFQAQVANNSTIQPLEVHSQATTGILQSPKGQIPIKSLLPSDQLTPASHITHDPQLLLPWKLPPHHAGGAGSEHSSLMTLAPVNLEQSHMQVGESQAFLGHGVTPSLQPYPM